MSVRAHSYGVAVENMCCNFNSIIILKLVDRLKDIRSNPFKIVWDITLVILVNNMKGDGTAVTVYK